LSGAAAGPFGVPARNAGELLIEALNAGMVPPPYDKKGINGAPVETVIVDEAGGTTKQSPSIATWCSGRTSTP
ncbi:MAG TPA: hypothetical protein VFY53_06700, partial [Rhodoplanes sp.]|nr:hypothetical protein [Rhodoplanes sp.]